METQYPLQSMGLGLRIGLLFKARIMTLYWSSWPQPHNHPYLIILGCVDWAIPCLTAHLDCLWVYCVLLTMSIALCRSGPTRYHFDPASYYSIMPTLLLMITYQYLASIILGFYHIHWYQGQFCNSISYSQPRTSKNSHVWASQQYWWPSTSAFLTTFVSRVSPGTSYKI